MGRHCTQLSADDRNVIQRGLHAGLLPLLAEISTQAAAIRPLAIAVVFGLPSSTVLVPLALPALNVLYVLFDDWGWTQPVLETDA